MNNQAPPCNSGSNDFRRLFIIQITIILLAGVAAYCNSLYGPFHFDDLGISEKTYLWPRAFSPGPRQLVDLTFVMNHMLHGEDVFGYHLVNVVVHLATAVALYGVLNAILTSLSISFPSPPGRDTVESQFLRRFIPFAAALLFVSHPVQTQAVTYIVQRYASMVALFYLCCVLAFILARQAAIQNRPGLRIGLFSLLSLVSAILALRCKETAYTLPAMLIVVECFLFRGVLLRKKAFVGGIVLILLLIPVMRIAQHGFGGLDDLLFSIDRSTKEELTYSRSNYLLTQFRVIVSYIRLLLVPVNLNLDHDVPLQKSFFTFPVISSLMLHLSLLATSLFCFIRSGRLLSKGAGYPGICLRLISFGIIWFYLALSVESSIIPILDVMFEHRLYLPSAGGFLVMAATVTLLAAARPPVRTAAWLVLAAVTCACVVATIKRNRVWNDDLRLWEDTARKSPNKPRVLANLTAAYLVANKPEKALPVLIRTLELSPGLTDSLNNLGSALDMLKPLAGRYDNGRRYILRGGRTIDMRHYNAWFANTRNNLGLVYEYTGNYAAARRYYETAISLSPSFELAWYNLYLIATRQQDHVRAAEAHAKLLSLNPELARSASLRLQAPLQ